MNKNLKNTDCAFIPSLVLAASVALSATLPNLHAVDGTWAVDANGNWSDTTKWAGGVVADGIDGTANFVFDITAARTVTNDTPRTIGNINFDDTGAAADSTWVLAGTNANPITLSTTTGTSTINTSGSGNFADSFQITALLAGSNNIVLNSTNSDTGARRQYLVSNPLNSYTGTTTVQNGFLRTGANSILAAGSPLGVTSSAIILGNANTTANTAGGGTGANLGFIIDASTAVPNITIDRNIDSSTAANNLGRTDLIFNGPGGAAGTLTVSGNWTLGSGATRGYGVVISQAGQTINFTGAISGGGATPSAFRVNDFGGGLGTLRLANANSSFTNTINIEKGTLLIANNAAAGAVNGALGTATTVNIGSNGVTAAADVISALIDGAFTVGKVMNLNVNGGNASANVFTHVLGGTQAVASTYSGAVNTTNVATNRSLNVTQVAGGTTTFSGVIGANADATAVTNLDKVNAGTAVLTGSNLYDGTTRVLGGTLLINNTAGSGTGIGPVNVGVVSPAFSGQTGNTQNTGTAAATVRQINGISNSVASTLQLGQTITGTGITANSTITGIALGAAGTSSITISTTFSVPAASTTNFTDLGFGGGATATGILGGTGFVGGIANTTGNVTVFAGSSVDPGDAGAIGTLTIGSAATPRNMIFGAGSAFNIQVSGANSDLLATFGGLDLSSTTDTLNITGTLTAPSYTIATYNSGGLTGTFNTVTGNGIYTVNYTPTAIILSVPEPSTYALMIGGAGMLFLVQRRRRQS